MVQDVRSLMIKILRRLGKDSNEPFGPGYCALEVEADKSSLHVSSPFIKLLEHFFNLMSLTQHKLS